MKMFVIIYSDAADEDVIAALKEAGVHGYTKTVEVRGEGTDTEPKLGTHCWPGKNNMLMMAVADEEVPRIKEQIRRIQRDFPRARSKQSLKQNTILGWK